MGRSLPVHSEEEVDALEALMQFLYQAPIGLLQIRRDGTIDMANPMSAQLLMPIAADGALNNLFDVLGSQVPELREKFEAFPDRTGVVCEGVRMKVRATDNSGDDVRVVSLSVVKLNADQYMASLADVTLDVVRESKGVERRLHDAARFDSLTKLPNRTAALEALQFALDNRSGQSTAVLSVQVDRFRHINDGFGHAVGDIVLKRIGERILSAVHKSESQSQRSRFPFTARVGGDKFAVVLNGPIGDFDAGALTESLLLVLSLPHVIDGRRLHAPASIGVIQVDPSMLDTEDVLQNANLAAAEASRLGGARCITFDPNLRMRATRRSALEEDLRRALTNDELFVVYQPVVRFNKSCDVDRSAGVEALVRWRHPQLGLVGPGEFIAVAEESGLIKPLGALVLEAACAQHAAWRSQLGTIAPRLLAVNLSRAQLEDITLVDGVRATLNRHGMDPADLQLEVTESLAAQDEQVQTRLRELKKLGLALALDDFGTGYSSLASLHQLPVDTVKIDRAFVMHLETSAHHRALVEATVNVARSLGMQTVAEGIETSGQAEVVRGLKCDKGQGWLFGRPMEGAALAAWLSSSRVSSAD